MKKNSILTIIVLIISVSNCYCQINPEEKGLQAISGNVLKAQMGFLASDWTEGRGAGERGEYLSSDYISGMLQLYGVKPAGDLLQKNGNSDNTLSTERSFFQNIILLKTVPGEEQILKIKSSEGTFVKTTGFTFGVDYFMRSPASDVEEEAPVLFQGYGIKNNKLKFNDLNKTDLKGKFVMIISGSPESAKNILTPEELSASQTEFENQIRKGGAVGIIEVYPNLNIIGNPQKKDFNNMSPGENNPRSAMTNASFSIPGKNMPDYFPRIFVSVKTGNEILKGTGNIIDDYLKKADENAPYSFSAMTGKSLYFKFTIKATTVAVRNILGIIEGKNPEQIIVAGAHYDHMGMNNGYIWNGADDNASGTVGVMTLAKAIMETGQKPEKSIIFALWTAEEEGLLGSRYWVQNPTCKLKNVKLNMNFDMISRYISEDEPKKVIMTYTDSFHGFKDLTVSNLNKFNIDLNIDYQPSADPPGGTDHRSFVAAGIPIIRFKSGHREEYHTPKDEIETINWDIMEKIIRISFTDLWELANTNW